MDFKWNIIKSKNNLTNLKKCEILFKTMGPRGACVDESGEWWNWIKKTNVGTFQELEKKIWGTKILLPPFRKKSGLTF